MKTNTEIASQIFNLVTSTPRALLLSALERELDTLFPQRKQRSAQGSFARTGDPSTSASAAKSVNTAKLEKIVLNTLLSAKRPLTMQEVSDISGVDYKTITPRFKPLRMKGHIQIIGLDRSAGRARQVYQLTSRSLEYTHANA
jgi:hypothetical protein